MLLIFLELLLDSLFEAKDTNKNSGVASPPKQKPSKKSKRKGKKIQTKIVVQAPKERRNDSGRSVPQAQIDGAVRELVTCILKPDRPFRLPRPTAPLVHACILQNEILLEATDSTAGVEAVIAVRQDLDRHIEIWSPSASLNFTGKKFDNIYFQDYLDFNVNSWVSVPTQLESTGAGHYPSVLLPVSQGTYAGLTAFNHTTERFEANKVWAFPMTVTTPGSPRALTVQLTNRAGIINPGGGILRLDSWTLLDGQLVHQASTDITLVAGTVAYTTSFDSTSGWVSFVYALTASDDVKANIVLNDVAGTYTGVIHEVFALANSNDFDTLMETTRKYCISAFDALCSFEGGLSSAGHISCCLLPDGEIMPIVAQLAIDRIAKLPKRRKFEGSIGNGAHVSWMPDSINQLWLRPQTELIPSQTIWIAFKGPPAGDLQVPQMRLYTSANLEAETYSQIYNVVSGCNAGFLMEAIVNTYGEVNPCSENPNHFKKVTDIARNVVKDPFVQDFARLAVKAGKVILPTLIGLL